MWKKVKSIILALWTNHKFKAMLIGQIVTLAAGLGFSLDAELVGTIMGILVATFIGAEAVAKRKSNTEKGKE